MVVDGQLIEFGPKGKKVLHEAPAKERNRRINQLLSKKPADMTRGDVEELRGLTTERGLDEQDAESKRRLVNAKIASANASAMLARAKAENQGKESPFTKRFNEMVFITDLQTRLQAMPPGERPIEEVNRVRAYYRQNPPERVSELMQMFQFATTGQIPTAGVHDPFPDMPEEGTSIAGSGASGAAPTGDVATKLSTLREMAKRGRTDERELQRAQVMFDGFIRQFRQQGKLTAQVKAELRDEARALGLNADKLGDDDMSGIIQR